MRFFRHDLCSGFSLCQPCVVVIDVLRAFSCAPIALDRGARRILPVRAVEEAFALGERLPHSVRMGEVGGLPIEGFDFGNSPVDLEAALLEGREVIQRTSAGTQGLHAARGSELLLAGSLLTLRAMARAIESMGPEAVHFVITGTMHGHPAEEDHACADALEILLDNGSGRFDPDPILQAVMGSRAAANFVTPGSPQYRPADLEAVCAIDRFDFAVRAFEGPDGLELRAMR